MQEAVDDMTPHATVRYQGRLRRLTRNWRSQHTVNSALATAAEKERQERESRAPDLKKERASITA